MNIIYIENCNKRIIIFMLTELSNLVLMRNSTLGQSAPSLSNSLVCKHYSVFIFPIRYNIVYLILQRELHVAGCGRRSNKSSHRKSFISNTSPTLPRCHSPMSSNNCYNYKFLVNNIF